MTTFALLAALLFIGGYILITVEQKVKTHKSAVALAMGGLLWIIVALSGMNPAQLQIHLEETGSEIFSIVVFLLSAMTLVEILVHYQLFDFIRIKLLKLGLKDHAQFLVLGTCTFFLSAILDNLTTTIVMIQIARRFFKNNNLTVAACGIVILANAGGAWSPIGDVTTIMIWLADKFSASDVILKGFLPSSCLAIIAMWLLGRKLDKNTPDIIEKEKIQITKSEKAVIAFSLASFSLPLIMNFLGLPPYMGLLLGLGIVWLMIEFFKIKSDKKTHLDANIDHLLQKTDIASLKFFIGILLAVSALKSLGILEQLSVLVLGEKQDVFRIITGSIILGPISAVIDNVPLTALALDIIKYPKPDLWVLLAFAVGTGGSLLIIGSAAGVVAMGMVKELTFGKYFKIAFVPAALGYIAGILVWLVQYQVIK